MPPSLSNQWRSRLLKGAAGVFGTDPLPVQPTIDVPVLHANIDELTLASISCRCAWEEPVVGLSKGRSVASAKR